MRTKKLEAIPTSGQFDEVVFDLDTPWKSNKWNYAVFTTSDHSEWLGMFRDNDLANFKIAELDNGTACVISGGHAYIIDIDKRTRLKDLKTERVIDVIADAISESFFISTWFDLTQVTNDLNEVEIKIPIRTDGIYFCGLKDRKLSLEIEEIGADMKKTKDFYVDLNDMTVKKYAP